MHPVGSTPHPDDAFVLQVARVLTSIREGDANRVFGIDQQHRAQRRCVRDRPRHLDVQDKQGETPWSMAAGLSPVLKYRGQYGSHQSTAALLLTLGARSVSQDKLDARAAAAR